MIEERDRFVECLHCEIKASFELVKVAYLREDPCAQKEITSEKWLLVQSRQEIKRFRIFACLLKSHSKKQPTLHRFYVHLQLGEACFKGRSELKNVLIATHFESNRNSRIRDVGETRCRVHRVPEPSLGPV